MDVIFAILAFAVLATVFGMVTCPSDSKRNRKAHGKETKPLVQFRVDSGRIDSQEALQHLHSRRFWLEFLWIQEPSFDNGTLPVTEFSFRLLPGWSLIVRDHLAITLDLMGPDGEKHSLGWWDARFHPFALTLDEFLLIADHLEANGWEDSPFPSLALCRFVGIGAGDDPEALAHQLRQPLRKLGCFSDEEANDLLAKTIRTKPDMAWEYNPEYGWVFDGDYNCYSIRNPDHSNYGFPFTEFQQCMDDLEATMHSSQLDLEVAERQEPKPELTDREGLGVADAPPSPSS